MGTEAIVKTATGVIYANTCEIYGMQVATDGVNNPTITVYDNASAASGTKVIPTCEFNALAKTLHGFTTGPHGKTCHSGAYVEITCAGTVIVTFDIKKLP